MLIYNVSIVGYIYIYIYVKILLFRSHYRMFKKQRQKVIVLSAVRLICVQKKIVKRNSNTIVT